jgi:hypothetical protein
MAAQPPAVGVTDMGDPALDAGIQLSKADLARMIGREPRAAGDGRCAPYAP